MDIIYSEPKTMEIISHMEIIGRKCAQNRTGRKIHHVIRGNLSHERLTPKSYYLSNSKFDTIN